MRIIKNILLPVMLLLPALTFGWQLDTTELYDLEKLGTNVNSRYHESAPVVSPDGNTLYWFVENHPDNTFHGKESHNQDIWYSTRDVDGSWLPAKHMESPLNQSQFNQVLAVLNDGNTLLIRGGTSKNDHGLALTHRSGDKWSRPDEVDIDDYDKMNEGVFSGGALNSDGSVLILYFAEKAGSKFSDLYVSFRIKEMKYSRPVKLALSTFKDEFGPFIAADDKTMYFASNRYDGYGDVDVWVSTRLDDTWLKWSEPVNLGPPVNTKGFDAYFSIDAEGKNAFTSRAYMSADGGSLDILGLTPKPEIIISGTVKDKTTGKPVPGFVEVRVGEKGIVSIETDDKGYYSKTFRERATYQFRVDEKGYQILYDSIDLNNAGFNESITKDLLLDPIPAEIILFGFVTNSKTGEPLYTDLQIKAPDGKRLKAGTDEKGYYTTRLPAEGDYEILATVGGFYDKQVMVPVRGVQNFYLEVGQDIALDPEPVPIVLKGTVTNSKTGAPMAVTVRAEAATAESIKVTAPSSQDGGKYSTTLPEAGWYYIYAGAEGFLNYNDSIEVYEPFSKEEVFTKDIALVPIEIGVTVRLNKIYFDFNKADLREESFAELDRLVELMNLNPSVKIEIAGHTDDKGSDEYNQTLSQGRAESVMNYLLEQGIGGDRVVAKGYGESAPEVPNDSDENRQINRRVEFTVLSK